MREPYTIKASPKQLQASDPNLSIWVKANAGSGKTHVLILRLLRLMLEGVDPAKILCVTYTRVAAAHMRNKLFDALRDLSVLDDAQLAKALAPVCAGVVSKSLLKRTRALFVQALDTPGGMRIQTMHSFAESLLKVFPFEAGVPPSFSTLEDNDQKDLMGKILGKIFVEPERYGGEDFCKRVRTLFAQSAMKSLQENVLDYLKELELAGEDFSRTLSDLQSDLFSQFGIDPNAIEQDFKRICLSDEDLRELRRIYIQEYSSQTTKQNTARQIEKFLNSDRDKDIYCEIFTKSDHSIYKSHPFLNKEIKKAYPLLSETIDLHFEMFPEFFEKRTLLKEIDQTLSFYALAKCLHQQFEQEKRFLGVLTFQDMMVKLRNLFLNTSASWIRYKLDYKIDHILIDEAQDTNTMQWDILDKLSEEFFAGIGTQNDKKRTIFAVGDEKQSIYGFQGANPEAFDKAAKRFERIAGEGNFNSVPLLTSYRSAQGVLDTVDRVFGQGQNAAGLTQTHENPSHKSFDDKASACFEKWILSPDIHDTRKKSLITKELKQNLSQKIAQTIKTWIDEGWELPNKNRPIHEGDILILLETRSAFFHRLLKDLQLCGLKVAGADKLKLLDFLAVKDMLSLARAMSCLENDLALAEVLKSPLFRFDDDDLLLLTEQQQGLWQSLSQSTLERHRQALTTLTLFKSYAHSCTPLRFFHRVLKEQGAQQAFVQAMGQQVCDPLESFLDFVQKLEQDGCNTLPALLIKIANMDVELKRELGGDVGAIRVMSVHGAKGLEAPVVICVGGVSQPNNKAKNKYFHVPVDNNKNIVFYRHKLYENPRLAYHKTLNEHLQAKQQKRTYEARRLLYVAMTRAEDVLILAGVEDANHEWLNLWGSVELEEKPFVKTAPQNDAPTELELDISKDLEKFKSWRTHVPELAPLPQHTHTNTRGKIGETIHKMAEKLPCSEVVLRVAARKHFAHNVVMQDNVVQQLNWLQSQSALKHVLSPLSKVEQSFLSGEKIGRIDRLMVGDDFVHILDLKTGDISSLIQSKQQVGAYAQTLKDLFPNKTITAFLAYSATKELIEVNEAELLHGHFTKKTLTN